MFWLWENLINKNKIITCSWNKNINFILLIYVGLKGKITILRKINKKLQFVPNSFCLKDYFSKDGKENNLQTQFLTDICRLKFTNKGVCEPLNGLHSVAVGRGSPKIRSKQLFLKTVLWFIQCCSAHNLSRACNFTEVCCSPHSSWWDTKERKAIFTKIKNLFIALGMHSFLSNSVCSV
jgi:hypothetical protein